MQTTEDRAAQKAKYYRENIAKWKHKYHVENKELLAKRNAKYRAENLEFVTKQKAKYYKENKEAINAKNRAYNAKNKDKLTLWAKNYREENPAAVAEARLKYKEHIGYARALLTPVGGNSADVPDSLAAAKQLQLKILRACAECK